MIPLEWLENNKIILIGELHGTVEIPEVLKSLCTSMKQPFTLAIEIPREKPKEFLQKTVDGRHAWKSIVAYAQQHAIPLAYIDSELFITQDEREQGLAEAVLKIQAQKIVVITGDVHAVTKKISIGAIALTPMGYYVKQKVHNTVSVQITAQNGTFFNQEVHTIDESLAQRELFDYVVELEKVHANTP